MKTVRYRPDNLCQRKPLSCFNCWVALLESSVWATSKISASPALRGVASDQFLFLCIVRSLLFFLHAFLASLPDFFVTHCGFALPLHLMYPHACAVYPVDVVEWRNAERRGSNERL